MIELSIVIPVKEEEQILPELISRLSAVLEIMAISYEIIFVTDINRDNTFELLKEFNKTDPRIKVLKLSNSHGQYTAVMAGLHCAAGDAAVTMDGDLQDYPEDIPKLYEKLKEGYDVVYGQKEDKNDSRLRNFASRSFLKTIKLLSDSNIDHNTNVFRVMSRRTVDALCKFGEKDPTITMLTALINFPTTQVEVTSGKRLKGRTKYNFMSLVNLAIKSILSYSTKPIRIISVLGLVISLMSFLYFIFIIIKALFLGIDVMGWPTITCLLTGLGGFQLLCMGVIGEYIGRIYIETKNRPLYITDEKIGELIIRR